ncbi:MAG: WD40 repeat domain-containing protein [Kistimonas sp.]|nr:WD40 repeat domain-containing protein [Kistimonas sp.]
MNRCSTAARSRIQATAASQRPVTPDQPAQAGQQPAAAATLLPPSERVTASVPPEPLVLPGPELSLWSDPLLLLILQHLEFSDLVRASLVSHQWHRLASTCELRSRTFLHQYSIAHRHKLDPVLSDNHVKQFLLPWCMFWPAGRYNDELVSLASRSKPFHQLFYPLVRALVCAAHFSIDRRDSALLQTGETSTGVAISPNGMYLSSWANPMTGSHTRIDLWLLGTHGFRSLLTTTHDSFLLGLSFTADSDRLLAVTSTQILEWSVDACTAPPARRELLPPVPTQCSLVTSADSGHKAFLADDNVHIFSRPEPCSGDWNRTLFLNRTDSPELWSQHKLLVFSPDSQHLLLITGRKLWPHFWTGEHWQLLPLHYSDAQAVDDAPVFFAATFSPDCRTLVTFSLMQDVYLWQRLSPGTWTLCTRLSIPGIDFVQARPYNFSHIFSPDGQHLALPTKSGIDILRPADRPPHWTLHTRLTPRPSHVAATDDSDEWRCVYYPAFSPTGAALLAVVNRGVQLWRYNTASGWQSAAWIDRDQWRPCRFAWSPDGFHCALALGDKGQISVWGPAPRGRYVCKLHFTQGAQVRWLFFTPDATRLLVVSATQGQDTSLAADASWFTSRLTLLPLFPGARQ